MKRIVCTYLGISTFIIYISKYLKYEPFKFFIFTVQAFNATKPSAIDINFMSYLLSWPFLRKLVFYSYNITANKPNHQVTVQ